MAEIRALQASMATAGADPAKVAKMEALGKQVGSGLQPCCSLATLSLGSSTVAQHVSASALPPYCCHFTSLLCCASVWCSGCHHLAQPEITV